MNEHIDMKISGSSSMPGGEYRRVSISGAGKVQGSLKCEELHCSGASNVQGDVDCAGELCTSGAGKMAGSVRCGSLTASGTFSAQTVQVEAALVQEAAWYFELRSAISETVALYGWEQTSQLLNNFITVGASGAAFGILLAFGMLFPNAPLFIIFIPIPIKAKFRLTNALLF